MRTAVEQQPESEGQAGTRRLSALRAASRSLPAFLAAGAAFFAAQLLCAAALAAQAPAAPTPSSTHRAAHRHSRPETRPATHPAPAAAPAPTLPNWPADKKPAEAHVVWDSHGLLIQASNSSLDQILREVSLKTGVDVEGMGADERIFGTYGPGPANDVLNQLLDGSGYNVLMIGDLGQGAPRKIVLTGQPIAPAEPTASPNPDTANSNEPENNQESAQPGVALPPSAPMAPGQNPRPAVPMRSPQEMMQDRQQQLQQMQQPPQN